MELLSEQPRVGVAASQLYFKKGGSYVKQGNVF